MIRSVGNLFIIKVGFCSKIALFFTVLSYEQHSKLTKNMTQNIFQQGIDLMLYGMGTVFIFLVCLIAITVIMSRIARHWEVEDKASPPTVLGVDTKTEKIVQQAINQHRKKLKIIR